MYMGSTRAMACPHCEADSAVQVDHGDNLNQCETCDKLFMYEKVGDGWRTYAV